MMLPFPDTSEPGHKKTSLLGCYPGKIHNSLLSSSEAVAAHYENTPM